MLNETRNMDEAAPACDASTYVWGYSIFSKGIPHCGKPAVVTFRGGRTDGKVCDFHRCAEHKEETSTVLLVARGPWTWTVIDLKHD